MSFLSQKLEIANEDKIPDYAEIEERTDSEGMFSSDLGVVRGFDLYFCYYTQRGCTNTA